MRNGDLENAVFRLDAMIASKSGKEHVLTRGLELSGTRPFI